MRASTVISFLVSAVLASADLTTTTEVGGICYDATTVAPYTQLAPGVTATVTVPGTLTTVSSFHHCNACTCLIRLTL